MGEVFLLYTFLFANYPELSLYYIIRKKLDAIMEENYTENDKFLLL